MKKTAIIIDDEKHSRDSLLKKINAYCPGIEVVETCESGEDGIRVIASRQPDLVFLDVEMPRMNGFTMLQQIADPDFSIIFTTAYNHYAIQAIRYSALDYLVKPIEPDELIAAVHRLPDSRKTTEPDPRIANLMTNLVNGLRAQRIAIPSHEGLQFIDQQQIIFLEAKSNYTEIHLEGLPKITVSKTLKDFEELLPDLFFRIHHSYLINKQHVMKYIRGEGGQVIMRNGITLDVSRRKKEEFLRSITMNNTL